MDNKVCQDCLGTRVLYPDGESKPSHPCPYCDATITYHSAQIIPNDPSTRVYWTQQGNKTRDILDSDIPAGAEVRFETKESYTKFNGAEI